MRVQIKVRWTAIECWNEKHIIQFMNAIRLRKYIGIVDDNSSVYQLRLIKQQRYNMLLRYMERMFAQSVKWMSVIETKM